MWTGSDAWAKTALHERYGPVVRISPTELSFSSGQAFKDIYGVRTTASGVKRTIPKDPALYQPTVNGSCHVNTTIDDDDHARQRRILAPSFSDKSLREQEPLLRGWSRLLAEKLREVGEQKPVDISA